MIKVTVELISAIDPSRNRHLGTAFISNDGKGTPSVADYNVSLSKRGLPKSVWKSGRVRGFKRLKLGAWDLLYLALRNTVGDRNG